MLTATVLAASTIGAGGAHTAGARPSTPPIPTDDIYGYADFYGVPNLGTETAAGTGCGGDGSIGDTIPDGYWRGHIRGLVPGGIQFDLVCVYGDNVDPDLVARWRSEHPGQADPVVPDGFVIDNSARVRNVPISTTFFSHGTAFGAGGACAFNQPAVPFDQTRDTWIRIVGGQAVWAVSSCAPAPQSTSYVFPYDRFFGVPQLGHEPVRGSGCGGDNSIGDTIDDGIWFGFVGGLDASTLQLDLACIYIGEAGQRLQDEAYAESPEGAFLTVMPDGWLVDNSSRLRAVPLSSTFTLAYAAFPTELPPEIAANWPSAGGSCAAPLDASLLPPRLDGVDVMSSVGNGVWVNIVNGHAQWLLANCLYN